MLLPEPNPVESADNLRDRVDRLFRETVKSLPRESQLSLDLSLMLNHEEKVDCPSKNIAMFLDLVSDAMPKGDVYLFGGILRDMALLGRKGFNSDIDLVVEGDWSHFVPYLESLKAHKNKFGGYRLMIGDWPVDIWNAEETWAIKQGLVAYKGVGSLTDTTVLNWDAILMNWRTKSFICRKNYFEEINLRVLDIVLDKNPNPLGMAVRVFRHLYLKDAAKITSTAAKYLAECVKIYRFDEIANAELGSYRNSVIERALYEFFRHIDTSEEKNLQREFGIASNIVEQRLGLG